MNRKFSPAMILATVALCCRLSAQPAAVYENNDTVLAPPAIAPNIDAITFLNKGKFIINFTNTPFLPLLPPPIGLPPFETQNTLNYSNFLGRFMSCNTGFRFESFNSQTGLRGPAASFFNDGVINCGTLDTTNYLISREAFFGNVNFFIGTIAGSKMMVNATNIYNPGVINLGFENFLTMRGRSVNLSRGTVTADQQGFGIGSGANIGFFFNQGIFDGYWGVGDVRSQPLIFYPFGISPAAFFGVPPPTTPFHPITNRDQTITIGGLVGDNAVSYVEDDLNLAASNRIVRAVFLLNTNTTVKANVYFPTRFLNSPDIIVEFTNTVGTATNNLYVLDYFGTTTNLYSIMNGIAGGNFTQIPWNYFVLFNPPVFLGAPILPSPIPPGTFNATATTNQWSAYRALLQPLSVVVADNAGQDVTNVPGRIEITGDDYLDLTRSHITSLNYLSLRATNHFGGSSRAQISSPYVDVNLRSTNGMLTITNLLAPVLNKPEGDIKLYSARWTNMTTIFGATITNEYHVLFVDSQFSASSPSRLQEAILRSTNTFTVGGTDQIVINDILNVTRTLLLDSGRITIDTNAPGSAIAAGAINLTDGNTVWPGATPRLKYLTNNGSIQTANTVFFGGSRTSPYYSTTFNEPYEVFVNRGTVTNFSSLIWSKTFLNHGIFFAYNGDIELQQALTANLADGVMFAGNGDIAIASDRLSISNHLLYAGGALTFSVTNLLDDSSLSNSLALVTNKNGWATGNGVNLLVKPALSSLLGTTITNTVVPLRNVVNHWAATDFGCAAGGFTNNAAVGRLIVDGGDESQFTFTGTGTANAIYVDYLELRNYMTNRDAGGNFIGLQIDPNMKVYYAQAVANGVSIAEKLDQQNGGRFCWVSDYAGFYSGTNVVYPDGSTNYFNAALIGSCNLDSDGDGLVNCSDTTPILRPQDVALAVSLLFAPQPKVEVSWQSRPFAANTVYYKTSSSGGDWQVLTNFVSGPLGGRVSIVDPVSQANPRYYRVRVDSHQP